MSKQRRPKTIEDLTALLRSGWVPDDAWLSAFEAEVEKHKQYERDCERLAERCQQIADR